MPQTVWPCLNLLFLPSSLPRVSNSRLKIIISADVIMILKLSKFLENIFYFCFLRESTSSTHRNANRTKMNFLVHIEFTKCISSEIRMQLANNARTATIEMTMLDGNCFRAFIRMNKPSHIVCSVSTNRVYLLIYCHMHISAVGMLHNTISLSHSDANWNGNKKGLLLEEKWARFMLKLCGRLWLPTSSNDMTSFK